MTTISKKFCIYKLFIENTFHFHQSGVEAYYTYISRNKTRSNPDTIVNKLVQIRTKFIGFVE